MYYLYNLIYSYRYDIIITRNQHAQSREPLAAKVRTKTGGLCGGFTPIQSVNVISD